MTTDSQQQRSTDVPNRAIIAADADRVDVRDLDSSEEGIFAVRLPIASTGEVRNEGDEPLTDHELQGMSQQIEERSIGVFLDHGDNPDVAGSRYSAVGKIGEWADPDLTASDGETELVADARMMDPETLPAATGAVREALAVVKSQAERDLSIAASIGWRDDPDFPGDVDLMEASIVGIPADPRTASDANADAVTARGFTDGVDDPVPETAAKRLLLEDDERSAGAEDEPGTTVFYHDDRVYVLGPSDGEPEDRGGPSNRDRRPLGW